VPMSEKAFWPGVRGVYGATGWNWPHGPTGATGGVWEAWDDFGAEPEPLQCCAYCGRRAKAEDRNCFGCGAPL
jgi:hypothetical protein